MQPAIEIQKVTSDPEGAGHYFVQAAIHDMLEVRLPPLCASCCRPADGAYLAMGGEDLEIKLEIPTCTECFERESAEIKKTSWKLSADGAPLAVLGVPPFIGWLKEIPALNFFDLSGAPLAASSVLGLIGLALWAVGTKGLWMGVASEGAVQVFSLKGGAYTLLFANAKYGMMFVAANGGAPADADVDTEEAGPPT